MDAADRAQLLPLLHAHRTAIVDRWYAAVARTSFSPRRAAAVRAELVELTDQAIAVLLGEPFGAAQAEAIGAALPRLHFTRPAALAGTLEVLGCDLVAVLPDAQARVLQPRLVALLAAIAAGFYAQGRAIILDEQDQVRRALFVTRQHAEAAEEARRVAEAAVRVRTDVLHAAAHDLRAPVTTILGHADLLRLKLGRETPPDVAWLRTQATAIRAGAQRIRAMVEEVLDVARLQAGQALELHPEPVDLGALVQEVARPRETSASGAVPLVVDVPVGLVVVGDRARLERVVDNVLGNAIKYSTGGTPVTVTVRAQDAGVVIVVRDQGVGIPADELPHLFVPFFRASTARGIAGIGIGLAGVKTIVEQHGGTVGIESAVGVGTTVTITLPTTPHAAEPARAGRAG